MKQQDYVNNQLNLPYLIHQIKLSKKILEEHKTRLNDLMLSYLNHKELRCLKFVEIKKYVRWGYDVDDLNQEADVILLELADKYLLDKSQEHVVHYLNQVFPKIFAEIASNLKTKMKSLNELEEEQDFFPELNKETPDNIQTLRIAIDKMEGEVKEVGLLMMQGYSLTEIEKELVLGPGSGWYYKEILFKKLRKIFGVEISEEKKEKEDEEEKEWL